MLPIDVTSYIGEETERGRKQKNIVKNNNCNNNNSLIIIVYSQLITHREQTKITTIH